jgi:flagellin
MYNSNNEIFNAQAVLDALQEYTNILRRIRELAVQSASETKSVSDRQSLQAEVNQLKQELTRIAKTTIFNGKNLLDEILPSSSDQVGTNGKEAFFVRLNSPRMVDLGNNSHRTVNNEFKKNVERATARSADTRKGATLGYHDLTHGVPFGAEKITVSADDSAKLIFFSRTGRSTDEY